MSSHAPASLPCNGFTLPYNPFTPQCTEYPFCCLSLWPTAPSQPTTPTHHPNPLPTPTHPSLYPFRSVSMSLKEKGGGGVGWCVSQRPVLSDAVRPSLSHGEHVMLDFVSVSFILSPLLFYQRLNWVIKLYLLLTWECERLWTLTCVNFARHSSHSVSSDMF